MEEPRKTLLVLAGHQHSLLNFRKNLLIALSQTLKVKASAPEDNVGWTRGLRDIGVDYVPLSFVRDRVNAFADLQLMFKYRRWIRQEKPAYLFAYTIKPAIYGSLAARATGTKVFVLITGLGYTFGEETNRRALSWAVTALYRSALATAEHVFFQNPDDAELFLQKKILGSRASFSVINGSGVDLNAYPPTTPPRSPVRFLLMARLIRSKGIGEYIEAAAAVKQKYPDCEFGLLGDRQPGSPDGLDEGILEAAVAQGWVRYLGATDNVVPFLQDCSVFVLPSYYREGVPRSILEALSVGRAIVTTDRPGCKETVVPGKNGFLIPAHDPTALARALEQFLENPELISEMGRASRIMAEEKYDDRKVNRSILQSMGLAYPASRAPDPSDLAGYATADLSGEAGVG